MQTKVKGYVISTVGLVLTIFCGNTIGHRIGLIGPADFALIVGFAAGIVLWSQVSLINVVDRLEKLEAKIGTRD
jgi:hypothetical protein